MNKKPTVRDSFLSETKFLKDLSRLVGFKTITGQGEGFPDAMEFITGQISKLARINLLARGEEPILLASNIESKTPDICYMAHLDVVSGNASQFQMRVENGVAYGRGVSDMKFAIPIGYALLNSLIASSSPLSFLLAITCDEERGGFHGAGFLAEEYGLRPKLLIVPDGGDDYFLVNKSKGVCQIKISMQGKPAHSSQPWLGESAINPIVKIANLLLSQYEQANASEGWHTTMNLGVIIGGKQVNQVAADAELNIDFRFPPEQDSAESLTAMVKELAMRIDTRLKVEVTAIGIAAFTDPDNPAIQLFRNILQNKIGKVIPIRGEHGSDDARHFSEFGVPFIMTKPAGGDIHGDNEHLDVASSLLFYQVLLDFLDELR